MNAVVTRVNYADFLKWTLPANRKHFDRIVVVTTPEDLETAAACDGIADVVTTDQFTANASKFAKYAGVEIGLDAIGRDGWIAIMDADVILPSDIGVVPFEIGNLYSPFRRMCHEFPPPPEGRWAEFPRDRIPPPWHFLGYCQIFHANDPVLGTPPWHGGWHKTAARGDMVFMERWPRERRVRTGWDVLHLGDARSNWSGRVTPRYS